MYKFFLYLFISITLFAPLYYNNALASFPDVDKSNEFYTAIDYVQSNSIVNGYSDGTYQPTRTITRGEFTKILINSKFSQNEINACNDLVFPDVEQSNVFKKYICVANKNNIVNGFSDGTYKSDTKIEFGASAKIIANSFNLNPDLSLIDDQNKFKPYVNRLAERNAIPETVSTINAELNRGEMAELIYRLMENIENKGSRNYDELINLPTMTPTPNNSDCSRDIYKCGDFSSREEAQVVFDYCMNQVGSDIHRLDGNNDGIACESSF